MAASQSSSEPADRNNKLLEKEGRQHRGRGERVAQSGIQKRNRKRGGDCGHILYQKMRKRKRETKKRRVEIKEKREEPIREEDYTFK